jgi:hypothetical protein
MILSSYYKQLRRFSGSMVINVINDQLVCTSWHCKQHRPDVLIGMSTRCNSIRNGTTRFHLHLVFIDDQSKWPHLNAQFR